MTPRYDGDPNETIGEVASRLVDDGKAYLRAEVDATKAMAGARLRAARTGIIVGVAAIFVAQAGLTVLFVAIGWVLAIWLPQWAGLLIAALLALVLAGLMVRYAIGHISPSTADSESKTGTKR